MAKSAYDKLFNHGFNFEVMTVGKGGKVSTLGEVFAPNKALAKEIARLKLPAVRNVTIASLYFKKKGGVL